MLIIITLITGYTRFRVITVCHLFTVVTPDTSSRDCNVDLLCQVAQNILLYYNYISRIFISDVLQILLSASVSSIHSLHKQ